MRATPWRLVFPGLPSTRTTASGTRVLRSPSCTITRTQEGFFGLGFGFGFGGGRSEAADERWPCG